MGVADAIFCKDIILKDFLSFSGKIGSRPVFRPSRGDCRPLGEKTSVGRRFRFIGTPSSILQDGASTSSTNAVSAI